MSSAFLRTNEVLIHCMLAHRLLCLLSKAGATMAFRCNKITTEVARHPISRTLSKVLSSAFHLVWRISEGVRLTSPHSFSGCRGFLHQDTILPFICTIRAKVNSTTSTRPITWGTVGHRKFVDCIPGCRVVWATILWVPWGILIILIFALQPRLSC